MVLLSSVVIAGGLSRRFGSDKRELLFDGRSFLDVAIGNAREVSTDVIVSLRDENQIGERNSYVKYIFDEVKDCGPLFGLASALEHCEGDYVALLPVDAPLLCHEIYGVMLDFLKMDQSLSAVVPISSKGTEPLFGVYKVNGFLSAIKEAVKDKKQRVTDAVSLLKCVKFLDVRAFIGVDPKLLSFYNINTTLDLEQIKELLD